YAPNNAAGATSPPRARTDARASLGGCAMSPLMDWHDVGPAIRLLGLGFVQRAIGHAQKRGRRPAVTRIDGHPGADRKDGPVAVGGEPLLHALRDQARAGFLGLGQDDDELIPAEARGRVRLAARAPERLGDATH